MLVSTSHKLRDAEGSTTRFSISHSSGGSDTSTLVVYSITPATSGKTQMNCNAWSLLDNRGGGMQPLRITKDVVEPKENTKLENV